MKDLKILDDFNLKIQLQVAWVDMDMLKHVNSSKYFAYFEGARIKYYENLGLLEYFSKNNIAGVISRTECTYFVPLSYPDTLTVGARVTEIFKDKMVMEYFIKSELKGLAAIGDSETIFFEFASNKKIPIPKLVVDEISNFDNCIISI